MTDTYKEDSVRSGCAVISFSEAGKGEALVMLHGNGEDRSCFCWQFPALSERFRCISVDSRGHGRSTHGSKRLTLPLMAGDALAVMDSLGLEKAHILGFSDGGNIALHLALMAPERISSLILSGANSDPCGIEPLELALMRKTRRALALKALFSREAARRLEIWELMLKEPHFTRVELESIKQPALITAGECDMILKEHTRYLHKCMGNSELVIFKGGSHFVHTEQAAVYNETVLNFLEKQAQEDKESGKETI